MSESKIHSALVAAYLASDVMPQARTAFEGRSFDPVAGQSWARLTAIPSGREPAALGPGAPQAWTGILQISLFHPRGVGTEKMLADVDKALAYFKPGARLEYESQRVLIRRSERSQIRQEVVWQSVAISIYCTAWIFPA